MKMALRNIGRQRARTTTTMLALFVGIFTIGLILALGQGLRDQVNSFIAKSFNYNVYALTSNNDTTTLRSQLKTLPGLTNSEEHSIVSNLTALDQRDTHWQSLEQSVANWVSRFARSWWCSPLSEWH